MTAPAPSTSAELRALLRQVELGRTLDTLPERLAMARTVGMGHAEFLELVLADEVTRRETSSAMARARAAGLEPTMCLENWDDSAAVTYDRQTWAEWPMSWSSKVGPTGVARSRGSALLTRPHHPRDHHVADAD